MLRLYCPNCQQTLKEILTISTVEKLSENHIDEYGILVTTGTAINTLNYPIIYKCPECGHEEKSFEKFLIETKDCCHLTKADCTMTPRTSEITIHREGLKTTKTVVVCDRCGAVI